MVLITLGAVLGRLGMFIYAGVIPFVLLWRQSSYRREFKQLYLQVNAYYINSY